VYEYRVTKYNPRFRNSSGAYTREEWTSFADIGCSFGGVELTRAEYERVEDAYVATAAAFLREAAVSQVIVRGLENGRGPSVSFADGDALAMEQVPEVLRSVLREECWCRLEGPDAFVHVGWDYYIYVGVPSPCPAASRQAKDLGLFVEDFASPYRADPGAALGPSRHLVLKKLRDCFPDPAKAEEALSILDSYGTETWHRERDRVQLSLLKISDGDIQKLQLCTRGALSDYRDALVPAEYPEEWQASSKTPPAEMAAIRKRDREQYEAWLGSGGA
jgi:hypothetical protein